MNDQHLNENKMSEKKISNPGPNEKKIKVQGPIRTGLVLFLTIFFTLTFCYFNFFFDSHLKMLMQWGATKVNGAEVNIAEVKTSFLHLSFQMGRTQFTDSSMPDFNIIEFDQVVFALLPDGILRAKVVINESSLLGLKLHQKRAYPGKVLPPEPVAKDSKPSPLMLAFNAQKQKMLHQAAQGNVLGDVLQVLQADSLKEGLENELKSLSSEKKIDALISNVKNKEIIWKKKYQTILKENKLKEYVTTAKSIVPSKNPKELLGQLKQLDDLRKKAQSELKGLQENVNLLQKDFASVKTEVSQVPQWIADDIDAIKAKLKIPALKTDGLANELFQRLIFSYVGPYLPYIEKIKPYWEANQSAKNDRIKPPTRGEGRNIAFPRKGGYPAFWLKKLQISASSSDENKNPDFAIRGELLNVNSSPAKLGIPISLHIAGDMRAKNVFGLEALAQAKFDSEQEKFAGLFFKGGVQFFALPTFTFADSDKVYLALNDAKVTASFHGEFFDQTPQAGLELKIIPHSWDVHAEKKLVQDILQNIVAKFDSVNVTAMLQGSWNNLSMSLESDFASKLGAALAVELNQQLNSLKAKLSQLIDEKLAVKKNELFAKFSDQDKQVFAPLLKLDRENLSFMKALDEIKSNLEKKYKSQGKEKVKEELKKGLDQLKGKIKLPF